VNGELHRVFAAHRHDEPLAEVLLRAVFVEGVVRFVAVAAKYTEYPFACSSSTSAASALPASLPAVGAME
jgi:hypothetical protein